jgi:hypothetical protein
MASNNFNTSKSNSAGAAVKGADAKASKAATPETKPVEEQRQGRGIATGRGGGAFDTAKTTPENK